MQQIGQMSGVSFGRFSRNGKTNKPFAQNSSVWEDVDALGTRGRRRNTIAVPGQEQSFWLVSYPIPSIPPSLPA
jgi:hypothetical protein